LEYEDIELSLHENNTFTFTIILLHRNTLYIFLRPSAYALLIILQNPNMRFKDLHQRY
jgi:hypothetical protein